MGSRAAAQQVEDALYPEGRRVPISDSRFDSICFLAGILGAITVTAGSLLAYNLWRDGSDAQTRRVCLQNWAPERCAALEDPVVSKMLVAQHGFILGPVPDGGAP